MSHISAHAWHEENSKALKQRLQRLWILARSSSPILPPSLNVERWLRTLQD